MVDISPAANQQQYAQALAHIDGLKSAGCCWIPVEFTGMKTGAFAPVFNDLQNSVELCRSIFGAGNETGIRPLSPCFPINFFAEVFSKVHNCSLIFCPRQQNSSSDLHGGRLTSAPHRLLPAPQTSNRSLPPSRIEKRACHRRCSVAGAFCDRQGRATLLCGSVTPIVPASPLRSRGPAPGR